MHHDPFVEQLAVKVVQLLLLGKIKVVDASGAVTRLQVDFGPKGANGSLSLVDGVPLLQQFGFASVPPEDTDVLAVGLNGERSAALALGTNCQSARPPAGMTPGDAVLFDDRGAFVWLSSAGLQIDAAGLDVAITNAASVTITAGAGVTVNGSVDVTDNLSVGTGATGEFTAASGQQVTVKDGIVLNITP